MVESHCSELEENIRRSTKTVKNLLTPLTRAARERGADWLTNKAGRRGPRVGLIFKGLGRIIKPPKNN